MPRATQLHEFPGQVLARARQDGRAQVGRRPRAWVTLTRIGGTAQRDELAALKALFRQLEL